MYRIRLASGEQAVYKTVEELAAAVSSGVVSPTAEVFHKAANRWLPINTHPDYRAVVTDKRPALPENLEESGPLQRRTPATRKSDAALELDRLELLPVQPAPAPVPVPAPVSAVPAPLPVSPEPVDLTDSAPRPVPAPEGELPDLVAQSELEAQALLTPDLARPRRPTVLIAVTAAGLVGAAAIAAILLTSGPSQRPAPRAPAQGRPRPAPQAPAAAALPDTVRSPAPSRPASGSAAASPTRAPRSRPDSAVALAPAPGTGKPAAAPPRVPTSSPGSVPPPPGKVTSRLGGSVNRTPTYYEAYADARAEMDESLAYVDFRRVFGSYRFASTDSIRAARRMVAAAVNILRVYRGREVMLEQTYRPGEPDGKGSLRESFEVAEASRGLLADVDSLYAILAAQGPDVRLRDGMLEFQNPTAARAYSQIRREILQTLAYLGDPAEAADRVTMPRLLRGIGVDRPPPGR